MDNRLNLVVQFGQKGLEQLQGGLRNLVGLGRTGSQAFRDMKREARALERELAGVRRELGSAAGDVSNLVDRERELERAVAKANAELRKQNALNKIDERAGAMQARGAALVSQGRDNVIGGGAMLLPLVLAAKKGAEFSSGMVDIQQKAELTDAATGRLANNIQRIATDARQFPEDIRSGLDLLLSRGMNVDAATAAIGPAARLSTAYKVDIPDAAGAAFASLNNLKVAARDTGRIFDVMAKAGNEGGFEVRDMARHFPSLTAQMAALGEKGVPAVADLSAALQVAMNTAGSADEAGNNIVNLLAKINAPGTIKKFEDNFGVNLPAAMKKLTDAGYSSLEAIAMITEKATGGDQKKLGFAFEDRQAQMGILALIQNMEEYRRIRGEAMKGDGTVNAAFDQRVSRDQMVQLKEVGVAMANLVLAAAPVLLPFLREVTSMMTAGVGAITSFAKAHPVAAGMVLKLFAALAIGRMALGGLQLAFGGLLGPMGAAFRYFGKVNGISRFGMHLDKFKGVVSTVASVAGKGFNLLRTGAMFLARGLLRAGLMMMANPMVLVIMAVVAVVGLLAYAVYSNWDTIKSAFNTGLAWLSGAWTTFKGYFWGGVQFLVGLQSRFLEFGKNLIVGLVNGIMAAPGKVWEALKNVVMGGINKVKKLLGIASPSRLFMTFGGFMAEGMAVGIDRRGSAAIASARQLAAGVAGAAALGTGAPLAAASVPLAPGPATAAASVFNITVNVPAGAPASDIALAVRREVEALDRRRSASARSEFGDG